MAIYEDANLARYLLGSEIATEESGYRFASLGGWSRADMRLLEVSLELKRPSVSGSALSQAQFAMVRSHYKCKRWRGTGVFTRP